MIKYLHPELEFDCNWRKKIIAEQDPKNFANLIDSTNLKQNVSTNEIEKLCQEAITFQFRSVCIPPTYVKKAAELLKNTNVRICTVIGFPLGYHSTTSKLIEVEEVVDDVHELDFVLNVTFVKNGDYKALKQEFSAIMTVAQERLVKVILETALLTADEIYKCSLLAAHSGIHVIKTSTGFSTRGASLEDIEIIKNALNGYQQETGNVVGIKASGGVRSLADAFTFIKAGATRIGTSGGVDIVQGRFSHSMY